MATIELDIFPALRVAEAARYLGAPMGYIRTRNPRWTLAAIHEPRTHHRHGWVYEGIGLMFGYETLDGFRLRETGLYPLRPTTIEERVHRISGGGWEMDLFFHKNYGYQEDDLIATRYFDFMSGFGTSHDVSFTGDLDAYRREMSMLKLTGHLDEVLRPYRGWISRTIHPHPTTVRREVNVR